MNNTDYEQCLVMLNVPPSLDEPVTDWLLMRHEDIGFTSMPVHGHSSRHDALTLAEQVRGRQRRVQFQIHMPNTAVDAFLSSAREAFSTADLRYSVLPMLVSGRFTA